MSVVRTVDFITAAIAIAAIAVYFLTRPEYAVLDRGVVVVTGASSGIGRHFVEAFAAKYTNHTVLAGVRKESDAASIRAVGLPNLQPLTVDVTSKESCSAATESILSLLAAKSLPLVALVNNAGTARNFPVEFHDLADIRYLYETNVFGMVQMTQMLLPTLRRDKGRIVMISSVAGRISTALGGVYASTKFAMEAISDALRRELDAFGVSVSVIEPAYVKSNIFDRAIESSRAYEDSNTKLSKEVYSHFYSEAKTAKRRASLANADEPVVTTQVIEDAIVNPRPQSRYTVAKAEGLPATILTWIVWLLPDRLEDFVLKHI